MGLLRLHPHPEVPRPTIPQAVAKLKAGLPDLLPEARLLRIASDLGIRYRQRCLTPAVAGALFLQQVLHGHVAVGELRRLTKVAFTESAYCQARQRLTVGFFRRCSQAVLGPCRADADRHPDARWRGHRVFGVDGSSFSMPDSAELRAAFGYPPGPADGCGFPTAHLLVPFDLRHGYLLRAVPAPCRTHDTAHAALRHQDLRPGDVVLGDRALCSYAHLALCRRRRLHGLFRAHRRLIVCFRPHRRHAGPGKAKPEGAGRPRSRWLKRLGQHDQLVEYFKPGKRPRWMTAEEYAGLPESIVVRAVRFRVRIPGYRTRAVTLVTTLTDAKRYPARALARLYAQRWQVEVNLRHLKQTVQMDVCRCTTFVGVMKELQVFVLAYNLVRRGMARAAERQRVEPDRISFVDALRWLRHVEPGEELPPLKVNPDRPGRGEPRARKRRPKQYDLLNKPRAVLRRKLLQGSPGKNMRPNLTTFRCVPFSRPFPAPRRAVSASSSCQGLN
jgi:Transposase DDE domain